jgi:hypothetical protein
MNHKNSIFDTFWQDLFQPVEKQQQQQQQTSVYIRGRGVSKFLGGGVILLTIFLREVSRKKFENRSILANFSNIL